MQKKKPLQAELKKVSYRSSFELATTKTRKSSGITVFVFTSLEEHTFST